VCVSQNYYVCDSKLFVKITMVTSSTRLLCICLVVHVFPATLKEEEDLVESLFFIFQRRGLRQLYSG